MPSIINEYVTYLQRVGIKTINKAASPTPSDYEYSVPTIWTNTGLNTTFILADNTSGAAVWTQLGVSSEWSYGNDAKSVFDASVVPPGAPSTGDSYILGVQAIDAAWTALGATNADYVVYNGSTWDVRSPEAGLLIWLTDTGLMYLYTTLWVEISTVMPVPALTSTATHPNTSDNTQTIGTIWVDTASNDGYILTDITGGVATWIKFSNNKLGDAQDSVLSIADGNNAPPSEIDGNRYIITDGGGGVVHADWDGASFNDIVQFDGATWVAFTPTEGAFCEVEDVDTVYIFITSWAKMFQSSGASFPTDSGTATPDALGVTNVVGTSAQGLSFSGATNTITGTIADATTAQKGVSAIATGAEVTTATEASKFVAPSTLNTRLGAQTTNGIMLGGGGAGFNLGATAELADGEILVGKVGLAPVAATPTGGSHLTFTGGAGTFDYDLSANVDVTAIHGWNGTILENPAITVTSDGATITLSLEKSGGGDLTLVFSDEFTTLDCTPTQTVALTAGTDTAPVLNYLYILQSAKTVITKSTSSFPSAEHVPLATVLCQSAASLQTDQAYKVHQWSDHLIDSNDQGHISHLNAWIRTQNATWKSGVAQTFTITPNGGAADNVIITTASGVVLQLHDHTFPAFAGTPDLYVVNDNVTPYNKVTDMNALLTDSTGGSMSGKYFSLVLWGVVSEVTGDCKLMVNLPSGYYNSAAMVTSDGSKYANFNIPEAFKGTGFLIAQWNLRHQTAASGTWTSIDEIDLRGFFPNLSGGSTAISSEFVDTAFRILDDGDTTKELAFQVSAISTATTRTWTVPDQNLDFTPTTGDFQASDATLTAWAGYNTDGILTQTAADTFTGRTLTGTANQVVIANGSGVGGNPTFSLPQDIATSSTVQFAKLGLGTAAVPHGGIGGGILALEGADASVAGAHMQFTTATDDYPLLQLNNWAHDNVSLYFDCYSDGDIKSSDAGSNFALRKQGDTMRIEGDIGIAQGSNCTMDTMFNVDKYGHVTMPLQSCFLGVVTGQKANISGDGTVYTAIQDSQIQDRNNDYNPATGTFTSPVTSNYSLASNTSLGGIATTHDEMSIDIQTSNRAYRSGWYSATGNSYSVWHFPNSVSAADMDAADTAYVRILVNGAGAAKSIDYEPGSSFSGVMV